MAGSVVCKAREQLEQDCARSRRLVKDRFRPAGAMTSRRLLLIPGQSGRVGRDNRSLAQSFDWSQQEDEGGQRDGGKDRERSTNRLLPLVQRDADTCVLRHIASGGLTREELSRYHGRSPSHLPPSTVSSCLLPVAPFLTPVHMRSVPSSRAFTPVQPSQPARGASGGRGRQGSRT